MLVMMAGVGVVVSLIDDFDAAVGLFAGGVLELHGGVINAVAVQQVLTNFAEDAVAFRWRDVFDGDVGGKRASLRAEAPDVEVVHVEHAVDHGE